MPAATDTVRVHYRGTFQDGKEFDSSYKRGEPTEFPLNRVIPCWTEGVQLMKPGGKALDSTVRSAHQELANGSAALKRAPAPPTASNDDHRRLPAHCLPALPHHQSRAG